MNNTPEAWIAGLIVISVFVLMYITFCIIYCCRSKEHIKNRIELMCCCFIYLYEYIINCFTYIIECFINKHNKYISKKYDKHIIIQPKYFDDKIDTKPARIIPYQQI